MKIWKKLIAAAVTVFFSAAMFYCFLAGPPADGERRILYIFLAGAFSIGMPGLLCGCFFYIAWLQRELKNALHQL